MASLAPIGTRSPIRPIPRWTLSLTMAAVGIFDLGWVIWFGHAALLHPHHIVGRTDDPFIYLWFLKWWGWAIAHHKNLTLTHLVSSPIGNSTLWDTGVPLFFIPASLLHWYFHVPLDALYNALWTGAWAGSGFVAFFTFYRLTGHLKASALGHLFVLFSAYENAESMAHLDLMWLGFLFLFLARGIEWVMGRRTTQSFIIGAVVLSLLQWLTNEELFLMMWIAVGFGLAVRPWLKPAARHVTALRNGRSLLGPTLAAAALTAVALSPLVWIQTHTAAQPAANTLRFAGYFGIDLQNLIITPVATIWHRTPGLHWFGDPAEDVGYLGILFFLVWIGYWTVERPAWTAADQLSARWLTLWWALLVLSALGPFLRWNGHVVVLLPGLIANWLPVVKDMVLPRFMSIAGWVAGLGAAWAFARSHRSGRRVHPAWLATGLIAIALSWLPAPHQAMATRTPERGAIPRVLARIGAPRNPVVLVFPYDNVAHHTNLVWVQAEDRFPYRLAEGYLSPVDPLAARFPHLLAAWNHLENPASEKAVPANPFPANRWSQTVRQFFQAAKPSVVIVLKHSRTTHRNEEWWRAILGPPSGSTDRTVYWAFPLRLLNQKASS